MTLSEFVVSEKGLLTMTKRGVNIKCRRCDKPIVAGDKVKRVATYHRQGRPTPPYYHWKCYEATLI